MTIEFKEMEVIEDILKEFKKQRSDLKRWKDKLDFSIEKVDNPDFVKRTGKVYFMRMEGAHITFEFNKKKQLVGIDNWAY